jgi:hypothetical protein
MESLEHPQQPDPIEQLTHQAYYQIIHTLFGLLPPPLADTQEAMIARNDAAIAKIAALAPINADEADIAAHCVAARAQGEEVLRLIRVHAGDIQVVMKLHAQYALMERTAVTIHTQLQRLQTARRKREPSRDPASADEWARYIAARLMQRALDQGLAPAAGVAPPPEPSLDADPSPTPAAQPPALAAAPPKPAPDPATVPPRRHRVRTTTWAGEQWRDLAAEADYYAIVYPDRARLIRKYGGLPPDCTFGPPDDELVHAIVTGTSPTLRALDGPAFAAA